MESLDRAIIVSDTLKTETSPSVISLVQVRVPVRVRVPFPFPAPAPVPDSGFRIPAFPYALSRAFCHREVQKDCQNRKQEIGYVTLENCPFLKTAYFQSLFSMWLRF